MRQKTLQPASNSKFILCAALALCAWTGTSRDIRDAVWFAADFDSATRLNGHAYLQPLAADGYVEGRYGKGYYFHRKAKNVLPPMASFLSTPTNFTVSGEGGAPRLACADGVLTLSAAGGFRVRPFATGNRPSYLGPTGLTCSFYVRGAKGTEVSLTATLSPLGEDAVDKAMKRKDWKTMSASKRFVEDKSETVTRTLDGTWQRVWCVAIHDNRVSSGRQVTLDVQATGAVEMRQFQYELSGAYPSLGFYRPSVWTDGGTESPSKRYTVSDAKQLATFPSREGSFSFWVKSSFDETEPGRTLPVWSLHRGWDEGWGYQGAFFRTGPNAASSMLSCTPRPMRSDAWRHVAGTWSDEKLEVFVDGRLVAARLEPKLEDVVGEGWRFSFGAYGAGAMPADAIIDDFAIFKVALTEEEVEQLATSDKGLFGDVRRVVATSVAFPAFYRNQEDAALRVTVASPSAGVFVAKGEIGKSPLPEREIRLAAGETRVALPFNPALYRPGRYPYAYRLVAADGSVAWEDAGELEIRGRLERDDWKYMSWGGSKVIHEDFLKTVGFNLVNVRREDSVQVGRLVDAGLFVNLRNENSTDWRIFDMDGAKIAAKARGVLEGYEGLHLWTSTLMNSEVYSGSTAQTAKNLPSFVRQAEQALGRTPDWTFRGDPTQLPYWDPALKAAGLKPFRGIVGPTNAALETLSWFMDVGNPIFLVNRATAKSVHELSPGNVAWTEPLLGPGGIAEGIDGVADWIYGYGTKRLLNDQLLQYGTIRGVRPRVKYMPTLSMNAFMGGLDPLKKTELGKPQAVSLCMSADEMNILSWIALGATRCDALSVYEADAWEYGVSNALLYAASPTNAIKNIAEADAPRRHGAFIKGPYRPAAMLLKGLENVRAPLAILRPSEVGYAAGIGYEPYHYGKMVAAALMENSDVPFDYVLDREITADVLSQYRCILFPMAYLLSEEHARVVAEVARRGVKIVTDRHGGFVKERLASDATVLKDLYYVHPTKPETVDVALTNWLASAAGELRGARFARSDRDAAKNGSFTFVKEKDGVRYVMVVNDGRSEKTCVLNEFKKSEGYRPLAAPQRITTEIAAPAGSVVCLFGTGEAVGSRVSMDYAPCEARIFTVYPRPARALSLEVAGACAPGRVARLRVALTDADGRAMPGRQLVRLTLTGPDGATRDESGLYPMDGGGREIPLRFAADEAPGAWKAEVVELTTGFKKDVAFSVSKR